MSDMEGVYMPVMTAIEVKGNSKVYVLRVLAMGVLFCSPSDK